MQTGFPALLLSGEHGPAVVPDRSGDARETEGKHRRSKREIELLRRQETALIKMLFISCLIWYIERNLHYVELLSAAVLKRRVNGQTK